MTYVGDDSHILYLSRKDLEEVELGRSEILTLVEKSFIEKGKGNFAMPPKHWLNLKEKTYFSAMSALMPTFQAAGVKWQTVVPDNPSKRGLPYLNGCLIINNLENGLPISIMDSSWITAVRTGIHTAVTAKYLARKESETFAILGCGVQGRTNLQALLLTLPKLKRVQAFDVSERNLQAYVEFVKKLGVDAIPCKNEKESIMGADVIVTAAPIHKNPSRIIDPSWLKQGVLAVPIDMDSYWHPEVMNAFDKFFVDDIPQILHYHEKGDFFRTIPEIDGDLGEIVTGKKQGRENQSERIMCMNLGVATEDMPIAFEIYKRAREKGIGIWLRR